MSVWGTSWGSSWGEAWAEAVEAAQVTPSRRRTMLVRKVERIALAPKTDRSLLVHRKARR